jgi:hypothetical protein
MAKSVADELTPGCRTNFVPADLAVKAGGPTPVGQNMYNFLLYLLK